MPLVAANPGQLMLQLSYRIAEVRAQQKVHALPGNVNISCGGYHHHCPKGVTEILFYGTYSVILSILSHHNRRFKYKIYPSIKTACSEIQPHLYMEVHSNSRGNVVFVCVYVCVL